MLETLPLIPRLRESVESRLTLRPPAGKSVADLHADLTQLRAAAGPHAPRLYPDVWSSPYPQGVLEAPLDEALAKVCEEELSLPARLAIEGWEKTRDRMTLEESGEALVNLKTLGLPGVQFSERPFEPVCGSYANKTRIFCVRESVAKRVRLLAEILSVLGITIRVEDGFRPYEVQAGLYNRRVRLVKTEHPDWDEARVLAESATKTAPTPFRAGHMAGAAVDITLIGPDGEELPRGNAYPQGGVRVNLWFPYLTWEEFRTRRIFAFSATLAGLTPYPGEDWHVSRGDLLGNIYWGERRATFGPIKSFTPEGEVEPMSREEMTKEFSA